MQMIGKNLPRVDLPEKARGQAKYTADYCTPDTLKVVLLRAKESHAKILSVKVPKVPEGVFVFTAKDLPKNRIPSVKNDQPALASEKIRYAGEPVAVVAAATREEAEAFAKRIEVVTEPLPPVFDMTKALDPETPKLFETGNLCHELHRKIGEGQEALRKAEAVFTESFSMPVQVPGYIENECAFTYIDEKGRLALVSATQNAYDDRKVLYEVLGLRPEMVTSRAAVVGGGFGGKDGNTAQVYAAIVTWFTKRPALFVFSKEESIKYGPKRHAAEVTLSMGFDREGFLVAVSGSLILDTGAYALLGPAVLELGTEHLTGPYYVPNIELDGWLVYTNHTPASAMRGFGGPQTAPAVETLMDRAAARFGLTPMEIRKKNALKRGMNGPLGVPMEYSFCFTEALETIENSKLYQEMITCPEPGCGYGLGAAIKSNGMGKGCPDEAIFELEKLPDGRYRGHAAVVDIGQGAQMALAMITAEALGVTLDRVEIVLADTENCQDSGSTAASRDTYLYGKAAIEAAGEIRSGKTYARTKVTMKEAPGDGVHTLFTCLCVLAKIKIDPVTGAVKVLDLVNVTDAGRPIHPEMMNGQIYGGLIMSEGYTLTEEVRTKDGRILEDSLASYIMPTALDAPPMESLTAPSVEETGPYGAKGVGEGSTIAVVPAIMAAIRDLCPGISLTKLPADREEILRSLSGKEKRA